MKRFLNNILLVSGLCVLTGISYLSIQKIAVAQTSQGNNELFYTFQGKKIPLSQRQDIIGVEFKDVKTRNTNASPLYLQLQNELQQTRTRGGTPVQVTPIGNNYALVKIPAGIRTTAAPVQQQIQQKAYVQATLPVITRQGQQEEIILANEAIVSFDEKVDDTQKKTILQQQNLEIIRPLRFTQNKYLVKSKSVSGTAILNSINQLNQVTGINSTSPNFIQATTPITYTESQKNPLTRGTGKSPYQTQLLPLQWHLDSRPLIDYYKLGIERTDLRATEAWKKSNRGRGVIVAVLDSFIQWDHPDLINSVYEVGNVRDKLPGEKYGWDFVDNDPDTRISPQEVAQVRPFLQDTFRLPRSEFKQKYGVNPELIQQEISGAFFHGTLGAGVIAARPQSEIGVVGVAPNAQFLPVTVGKGRQLETKTIVEGIYYAGARGVDVINMSFGSNVPTDVMAQAITEEQQQNPSLVFVASAGNEKTNQVGFPSGYKGVISVGATNLTGYRAPYSNFGAGLDVVAPGGDFNQRDPESGLFVGAILTTGGTWLDSFWQGLGVPQSRWFTTLDPRGTYIWTQGTSFSSPAVAGVVALMKGEDPQRRLSREQIINILKKTSDFQGLRVTNEEKQFYESQVSQGKVPQSVSLGQYFFGQGLVNAEAAVEAVRRK